MRITKVSIDGLIGGYFLGGSLSLTAADVNGPQAPAILCSEQARTFDYRAALCHPASAPDQRFIGRREIHNPQCPVGHVCPGEAYCIHQSACQQLHN
jgi:hypothetical protein